MTIGLKKVRVPQYGDEDIYIITRTSENTGRELDMLWLSTNEKKYLQQLLSEI